MEVSRTLIDKIYGDFCEGVHFAKPHPSSRTNEIDLVRGVLHTLQGTSSSLFYWDCNGPSFRANAGVYLNDLSRTSLHVVLNQFMYAATCLKSVEIVVSKVESSLKCTPPTLRAFACAVSVWLKRLRGIALKEEEKITSTDVGSMPTLLGMASALSGLCSGAEYLLQVVNGAIPHVFFRPDSSVPAAEMAVHVIDYLYKKLNEVCPVQGGEEEAYLMLIYMFVGSLLPYIEVLDSWIYEGTLDDPFEELFFRSNKDISVDEPNFWEKSYLLRSKQYQKLDADPSSETSSSDRLYVKTGKEMAGRDSTSKGKDSSNGYLPVCPFFISDIAKSIVSAGKSLKLIRHVSTRFPLSSNKGDKFEKDNFRSTARGNNLSECCQGQSLGLTLSEGFCASLVALIGHGDHISGRFFRDDLCNSKITLPVESNLSKRKSVDVKGRRSDSTCSEKTWVKLLYDTFSQKGVNDRKHEYYEASDKSETKIENVENGFPFQTSFCPENPAIILCQTSLSSMADAWSALNLSHNFLLPPLNDGSLRHAIFGGESESSFGDKGTNYAFSLRYDDSDFVRCVDDTNILESLFPFPTLLPSFQENLHLSELLPFQNNSTMPSRVLRWILSAEPKVTPLPSVIMQECLLISIKEQVDFIGGNILSKLMNGWRLMDELGVLRAIYLLGSGDLLQHFLTVMFNNLDKGKTLDDDFELNVILQESIGNSADSMLLSSPDSLVVSITNGDLQSNAASTGSTRRSQEQKIGIDALDSLEFTYKVPWPLELIANKEAIKKYNQVMHFLLKVKRAKFVLDKARRWMWKDRGAVTISRKKHWLVEQKLLHFVDAFHQYVMDRVYHSAWRELCQGMTTAGSLDEVIEVHEAYLLSIQRQCFVVPDKLWALIASRINSILGLALDFYTIQQTLSSGGAVSAIKARCEMEVDRIEKQFDDCIAFLLRVLSFKLNVGHFPHLADLVTRINYSYFYMSDTGNLVTAPGAESATSRLGKAFPIVHIPNEDRYAKF